MKFILPFVAVSVSIALAACSEESKSDSSDASAGAGGGAGTGDGSAGAGDTCIMTLDRVEVTVVPFPQDAGAGLGIDWSGSGVVTTANTNTFTVDPCLSDAGCTAEPFKINVHANGLAITLPIGAYVSVHLAQAEYNNGHLQNILSVRNLPSWAGAPNPVSTTETWYLLAIDGPSAHPDAPFEASKTLLNCAGDGEFYELAFREPGGSWITVPYGQVATLTLAGQAWKANVVRSYRPEGFDFASAEAWWFAYDPS